MVLSLKLNLNNIFSFKHTLLKNSGVYLINSSLSVRSLCKHSKVNNMDFICILKLLQNSPGNLSKNRLK